MPRTTQKIQKLHDHMGRLLELAQELEIIEERRQLALGLSYVGIWDWNVVSNELWWDEGMMQIYGIEPNEFKGQYCDWAERVHPEDLARASKDLKRCLMDPSARYFTRFRVIRKGVEQWVTATGNCIRNDKGEPIRYVGVNILEAKTEVLSEYTA